MELKQHTPLLLFLKIGVSKPAFDNIGNHFGLNSDVYYTVPKSKMNVVWGRINSNRNKVILIRYDDKESLEFVLNRVVSKLYSRYFHIFFVSHEDIKYEMDVLKNLESKSIEYDIISLQNKNFSKL